MSDDLARRAVASPHWRWMPGMLTEHGNRYVAEGQYPRRSVLPDLTDPATVGCLITLVQEAHPECRIDLCDDMARVIRSGGDGVNVTDGWHPTDEALVAALEAAP